MPSRDAIHLQGVTSLKRGKDAYDGVKMFTMGKDVYNE